MFLGVRGDRGYCQSASSRVYPLAVCGPVFKFQILQWSRHLARPIYSSPPTHPPPLSTTHLVAEHRHVASQPRGAAGSEEELHGLPGANRFGWLYVASSEREGSPRSFWFQIAVLLVGRFILPAFFVSSCWMAGALDWHRWEGEGPRGTRSLAAGINFDRRMFCHLFRVFQHTPTYGGQCNI